MYQFVFAQFRLKWNLSFRKLNETGKNTWAILIETEYVISIIFETKPISNDSQLGKSSKSHIFLVHIAYHAQWAMHKNTHTHTNNVQWQLSTSKWYETCLFHFCCSNIGLIKSPPMLPMLPNVLYMHFIVVYHTRVYPYPVWTLNTDSLIRGTYNFNYYHASTKTAKKMYIWRVWSVAPIQNVLFLINCQVIFNYSDKKNEKWKIVAFDTLAYIVVCQWCLLESYHLWLNQQHNVQPTVMVK